MNSKYYLIVIGILAAIIGALLVMQYSKNDIYQTGAESNYQIPVGDTAGEKDNENSYTPPQNTPFNWGTLSTQMISQIVLGETSLYFEGMPTFSDSMDLTGDGIAEGIFTGNGGNNGLTIILIRNSDGTIVAARQKNRDGSIQAVSLLDVGRVMVQEGYKLLPAQHGFYTESLHNDEDGGNFVCNTNGVNAYVWNSSTRLFQWNQALTTQSTAEVCH